MQFTANDWQGKPQTVTVKGRKVHESGGVTLVQVRRARYVVVYGLQVSRVMDYRLAAIEFGRCLMHSLSCNGMLDE